MFISPLHLDGASLGAKVFDIKKMALVEVQMNEIVHLQAQEASMKPTQIWYSMPMSYKLKW